MKNATKQNREKKIAALSEQTLKLAAGAEDYPGPPVGKKLANPLLTKRCQTFGETLGGSDPF